LTETEQGLKRTPLFDRHSALGGKIIDFGGWALPVQFTGIVEEHHRVRSAAGLFDVSHMGEIDVRGEDSVAFVNYLVTNDVTKLVDKQVMYTLMCYPDGGVVDDLLVYRYSDDHIYLVVNASNTDKDFEWISEHVGSFKVKVENLSPKIAQLALQGPLGEKILQKLTKFDLSTIKFFYFEPEVIVDGVPCIVSRTGYTGEDGFEIYCSPADAPKLWDAILEAGKPEGVLPIGLGARDTLRFEAKLPLYGHEIDKDITPVEAVLTYFVHLDKPDFIGKDALAKQKAAGAPRKLVGFKMVDRGVARAHMDIYVGDRKVGHVTTGTYAPTIDANVGHALIASDVAKVGQIIEVDVRGRKLKAEVVKTPFYKREGK
jgi:aminomethyltransferase